MVVGAKLATEPIDIPELDHPEGKVVVAKPSVQGAEVTAGVVKDPPDVQALYSLPTVQTERTCIKYVVLADKPVTEADVEAFVVPEAGAVNEVVTAYSYSTGVVPALGAVQDTVAEVGVTLDAVKAVGIKHEGVASILKLSNPI